MKIVHFIHKPFLAGAQRASLDILKSINANENDLYLIYADDTSFDLSLRNDFILEFEKYGIKTIPLKSMTQKIGFNDIFTIIELWKVLSNVKPDIINTISSKPFFIGGFVSFFLKIPIRIHTIQGLSWYKSTPYFQRNFRYFLEYFSMLFFTKIVFVNKYYQQFFPLLKHKFIQIPNGKNFIEVYNNTKNDAPDIINVLFVGRLDFQKDPLTLLKSFEYFISNYNGIKKVILEIVGDGPDRPELEKYVFDSKILNNNVIFHGWSNSVDSFFEVADIFISTPRYEAFGFVFIEAGYYNLPIIATNVEGVPEVVSHNMGGILCNRYDFISLGKALLDLCENEQKRKKMGVFHGNYCRDKFSSSKVSKLYHTLYFNH
jgi:glycosyltransferase involved in cell wall biosynthesis